ncbi:hypothetical protein DM02DRAFT_611737 [Periconia macrospinosa]|uniref:Uncharacterized protein n=1 Tax=Periconia macrospinosa TaxID=97972 RepID=A0A2V1E129_9PLEO|nr:hypothetical protein DM02DRAFT_611737 [Periconia macrospinosa]
MSRPALRPTPQPAPQPVQLQPPAPMTRPQDDVRCTTERWQEPAALEKYLVLLKKDVDQFTQGHSTPQLNVFHKKLWDYMMNIPEYAHRLDPIIADLQAEQRRRDEAAAFAQRPLSLGSGLRSEHDPGLPSKDDSDGEDLDAILKEVYDQK